MEELKKMGIEVIDLSLGAFRSALTLDYLKPYKLIILASAKRGKKELRIYKPELESAFSDFFDLYSNFKGYYMDVDSFLKASNILGTLSDDVTIIECEVVKDDDSEELSEWGNVCKELMKEKVIELLK